MEVPISATDMDGASSSDYSIATTSVVFDSGDTEKIFSFSATDDTENDDGERVRLTFGTLPARVSSTSPSQAVVSITDDDVPSVTVSFERASYSVNEGSSVAIKVILSADPERSVDIPVSATYLHGVGSTDFSGAPTTLNFGANDTEKTITFSAIDDSLDDDGEKVRLGFGTLPPGVSEGPTDETTVSITDDDVPSVTVSFEQASYTVAEGDTVMVKVKLSADPERTVTIPLTKTNQGGATSSDYIAPTNVVFNSGDIEKTITFSATQDTVDDDGESVKLGFGNSLPTRISEGSPNEATISITDDDVPSVTVSFEQDSYTVAEGSSATVKVKLSANPERTMTIPLLKVNQGGASSADYSGVPQDVVFNSGDTEKTFQFEASEDAANDDGESVRVSFGTLPNQVSAGTHSGTTVSITDDDVPSVTVSFEQASYTVAEGNTVSVKVKLSTDPERTVTIPLTRINLGGATSSDYSVPTSVVFNTGDTEKEITFSATQDTVDDDGESVKLGFGSSLPTGVTVGSTDETTVSITDDDVPSVTVSFEESSYTVAEGNTVTVKVKLSADPERTVTITLTKSNQGGASNSDYSNVPANVVFNSGDTEKTFNFSATDDTVDDDGESVKLGFGNSLPAGVSAGSTDETIISITDDDLPSVTVSFEQSSYTAPEGSSVVVKVKLSADPERTVEVPISATDMDGASSSDYSIAPQTVVFNSGDTERTFTFSATDDGENDDGERVRLNFGTLPPRVSSTSPSQAVVSITDNDHPQVIVSFATSSYAVIEGDSVTVTVTLSANPERTVAIPITATEQNGATASDYSVPTSVVFNSGETEKTFSFSATQDAVDDDGESVKLGFINPPTDVTEGTTDETTVSITDDDVPSITVSFEESSYTVAEGSSTTVKVKLSADPERKVTILLTRSNEGGASASDYSVPNGVVFNAGDTEKEFSFSATEDAEDDDGESVLLGFGNLPPGVSAGSTDETTVSITDDDAPSVTVSFEQPSYTVAEGNTVAVKVKLNADPEGTVTIPLTKTNQSGTTASDYSVPNSVVFNSGDTEKTFSFSANQDTVDDDGESVKLGFGNLPMGVSAGSTDETTISITDDDVPSVTVSFEQSSHTAPEGNSVTVKVVLSADPERTVTIPLLKVNQGGASSADYSGVPQNVVFNSGDTEKTFDFEATADSIDDDGESVRVSFGSLPDQVSAGTHSGTTISITDDDVPSVTVSFEQPSYTAPEGSSVTVKVRLSADPERTVTIPLSKTNQGGASNSDYSNVPANVVFNSGDTEKTFSFSATQDTVDDDGESVKLGFGNLPTGVSAGSTDETTVSITDDDVPSVTVSFEQPSYTVGEGNTVTVKAKLSADPERTVEVPISVTNMDGASSSDYSIAPQTVVFNSGDTERTFTFSATDDGENDDGERVRLTFGTLPPRVSSTSPSQAVVSITDNDHPQVTVSFATSSYAVDEGDSVTVAVTLSADPERTVTIPITATGQDGATASDYSVPTSVVFNSGDTEKTFEFEATDDEENDNDESVKLTFGGLPTAVSEGTTNQTLVSINDNDGGGRPGENKEVPVGEGTEITVSFEQASYTVREGSTTTIKLILSADPQRSVSIPLATTSGTGLTSGDYSGVPASLDFVSGDTEKSFILTAVQDQDDEIDETLNLEFGTLPVGLSNGTTTEAIVTIVDSVHVSFGASHYEAYEGGTGAVVTVELDSPAPLEIVIPITAAGMNGATSADWTGVPDSLTFSSGDTQKIFTVMAYDDEVEDDGETVEIRFGGLPAGVARGSPSVATVVLMNMEVPSCETAVWCATAEFANTASIDWKRMGLGLGFHTTQEPYLRYSNLSENRFTFRGKEYQVWSMFTFPGMHPGIVPGSPGRIPAYSTFSVRILEVVGGKLKYRVDRDHRRDWTLYIDGIALRFTDVVDGSGSGTSFIWQHPKLQDLYADWTDGDSYQVMIAEDPVSERPDPPVTAPTAPRYLRVIPGDGSLVTIWKRPLDDGNSDITHYRLQWKPSTESWSNANAVEETIVQPSWRNAHAGLPHDHRARQLHQLHAARHRGERSREQRAVRRTLRYAPGGPARHRRHHGEWKPVDHHLRADTGRQFSPEQRVIPGAGQRRPKGRHGRVHCWQVGDTHP